MKPVLTILFAFGLCAAAAGPAVARKAPAPKISMASARAIALKRAPGRIKDAEYEYEKGGWRFSFDIAQGKRIHEIGVDAMSGRIVEDAFETPGSKD